jgi:hypothetical protein
MERDNPFVHVYAANEDTIVHIRQLIYMNDGGHTTPRESCDGVVMTLMQFRSLMFHLRALDAQFMQGSEMRLTSPCENESKRIGKNELGKKLMMMMILLTKHANKVRRTSLHGKK